MAMTFAPVLDFALVLIILLFVFVVTLHVARLTMFYLYVCVDVHLKVQRTNKYELSLAMRQCVYLQCSCERAGMRKTGS